ncbi:protein of unknown function [Nitrospira japonica]|uniref:Lipoprotein n=1 Tax=Nitrospira japonica TaxID=1325564 RepID=A0A1W1I630_9BACT|nr:hypothetical protein [Nitrospira japonica]SLM48467.1 protein of unknown function [Nitrospira japonica]
MTLKLLLLSWKLSFVLIAFQGCIVISYGTYSSPAISDSITIDRKESLHWYGRRKGDVLALPNLRLEVLPINERVTISIWGLIVPFLPLPGGSNESALYSPFQFLMTLRILDGDDKLTLLPGEIVLQFHDGKSIRPSAFWGPQSGPANCRAYENTKVRQAATPITPTHESLAITTGTCVTLLFDRSPPPPDEEFSLLVKGIRQGGKPIGVPAINFQRESMWVMERAHDN